MENINAYQTVNPGLRFHVLQFFRTCLSCIIPSYYLSDHETSSVPELKNPHDDNLSLSSAASSATTISPDYDVFISHRGRDIKPRTGRLYDAQDPRCPEVNATFETDLYDRLNLCGFQVFLDRPEMQGGLEVACQIKHAIKTASIHIAILSPAYAESHWCLDELHQMSEAFKSDRAILIPVFYWVKPYEVRWPAKGPYDKALGIHKMKKRFDSPTISGWEAALNHAGDISGFELEAPNGSYYEGYKKLLNKVVGRVLEIGRIRSKYLTKSEIKKLLNEVLEKGGKISQFQKTVGSSQDCIIVGIVGPGGVGKTELVQDFFESNRSKYSGSCFLSDAKESSGISLQRRLIKDLTQLDVQIDTFEKGKDVLISRLKASSFHALIVLEDADDANQMDAVLSIKDILGSKSLILVTSRHEHVLERAAGIASIFCLTRFSTPSTNTNTKCRLGSGTLKDLPDSSVLDPDGSLKELWLHDSPVLKYLSNSYGLLNRLTELNIVKCAIKSLPITDMNNLEVLRVYNCRSLKELSFRTESLPIVLLRKARLLGGPREPSPQGVPPKLEHLWINSCTTLLKVGPLPTTLITVDLSYCNTLSEIEGLCYLERLEQLDISGCEKVEELPSLEKLKSLSSLKAYRCYKLKSIKGLASSINLRRLYVCKCHEMLQLLGVEDCKPLDELYARGCSKLQWTDVVLNQLRQRLKVVQVDDSSDHA